LSDLAMLEIFDSLAVTDLLKMDRVCSRFKRLQAKAFRSRKTLTIMVGQFSKKWFGSTKLNLPDDLQHDQTMLKQVSWSRVKYDELSTVIIQQLAKNFPKVIRLQIEVQEQEECIRKLPSLLVQ